MDKLIVDGGYKLHGEVDINGAKNASVALIPASILCSKGICTLENVPDIEDIRSSIKILNSIGCKTHHNGSNVTIDSTEINKLYGCCEEVRKMRASYYLLGALLGRFKEARVDLPGGCPIGKRPIDLHIKGFEALGAEVTIDENTIHVKADRLIGTNIFFDFASVGATINVMMAAVLAEGTTVIENAAKEPYIVDLANYLNGMGANIKGAGTDVIRIKGVEELTGCTYSVVPDLMEASTYMIAASATGGDVVIKNVIPKHLEAVTAKLKEMGVNILEGDDFIRVVSKGEFKAASIKTLPYPGFPTDVQQPMCVMMTVAKGNSVIQETMYESRFKYTEELKKMGAKIDVEDRVAKISGVPELNGTLVEATDLRAGAALVVAALIAKGTTEIVGVEHIDRGYPHIEEKFKMLGAHIKRISE
ncbi:UDP-N-acetylglucosamine 1-carboxyvinyltransferase [Hathewaya proteolytica DSM 3090]|uniref:UDP-N-acetylglucosamine 1-carboxyvinyltransferase n=1 Tax=Hathewaya proteolytica DSM 3090 TaxID=1121331 RepID=A0A1M6MTI3_9CLOT|nr:UDP-N-acetylglucosamine 1-carboxyvinyltransferase [Hathewaya proteolytica]SHJ86722.1 UDP-N-acetylglucosamine 1-carboxyvinyltransferase [Hathewaya proteolytica DSM 3090]